MADAFASKPYSWVPETNGAIPDEPVQGGFFSNGSVFYIGRAVHSGDLIPGKMSQYEKGTLVGYEGVVYTKNEYEVLNGTGVGWKFSANGEIPSNAIVAGKTHDGEPLYVGRAAHDGSLTPGKVSNGVLYIPTGGKELPKKEFDVLVEA